MYIKKRILHYWITHHGPLSDTASTVHLQHAHADHAAASARHTGQPLQPVSQVQPTHAL
jgi:hypothetical protein